MDDKQKNGNFIGENKILEAHRGGKIETLGKVSIKTMDDLALYYTPGVAEAVLEISRNRRSVYEYTSKANTIAIISDGTRVLGFGDVGPEAALPVIESKALLFKKFGAVDAVPLCISVSSDNEIVNFVREIAPSFGGIVIEDIKSPRCFNILSEIEGKTGIPILHDDQHGVAAVVLAGLINSLKVAGKEIEKIKVVINGAGAAGVGITRMLNHVGVENICVVDTEGIIRKDRGGPMSHIKAEIAGMTNRENAAGGLDDAVIGADVLIGVSAKGAFSKGNIEKMADKPIVFALANPYPEIEYNDAIAAGAFIAATGRSDSPNQINNLLAFPGIMRGMLDMSAKSLNYDMILAAAVALSESVSGSLSRESILPRIMDLDSSYQIMARVAGAVAVAAWRTGVAGIQASPADVEARTLARLERYASIEKALRM